MVAGLFLGGAVTVYLYCKNKFFGGHHVWDVHFTLRVDLYFNICKYFFLLFLHLLEIVRFDIHNFWMEGVVFHAASDRRVRIGVTKTFSGYNSKKRKKSVK